MPHNYRPQEQRWEREQWQRPGRRRRGGSERDQFESGEERRYSAGWGERPGEDWRQGSRESWERGRGFEGERSYPGGGYSEEFGHRRGRGYEGQGAGETSQGSFRGQQTRGYGDFMRHWSDEDQSSEDYFGAGSYYGGGYGTAPGSRASGSGSYGTSEYEYGGGYAGRDQWRDRNADWLRERGGEQGRWGRGGQSEEDWGRREGSFRGRGPKGYERSDERLKEIICERLTDDPRIDASDVSIEVTQHVVKLSGTVDERRTKYEIEELIERLGGVKDIDNQLRVQGREGGQGREGQQSQSGRFGSESQSSFGSSSSTLGTQGARESGSSTKRT